MGSPFALQIYKELFISASHLRLDVRKHSILLQTETKTATGRIKMDLDSAPFNEPAKLGPINVIEMLYISRDHQ